MANKLGEHLAALITQIQTKPIIILKYKDLNVLIRNNKRINNTWKYQALIYNKLSNETRITISVCNISETQQPGLYLDCGLELHWSIMGKPTWGVFPDHLLSSRTVGVHRGSSFCPHTSCSLRQLLHCRHDNTLDIKIISCSEAQQLIYWRDAANTTKSFSFLIHSSF